MKMATKKIKKPTRKQAVLLREGVKYVKEHALSFYMNWWKSSSSVAPCGTSVCYAGGIACVLKKARVPKALKLIDIEIQSVVEEALENLGPRLKWNNLWATGAWPKKFESKF